MGPSVTVEKTPAVFVSKSNTPRAIRQLGAHCALLQRGSLHASC